MDEAKAQIRKMLCEDVPFERMEAFIEGLLGLEDEDRAVLWLMAYWGEADMGLVGLTAELGRIG